MRCTCFQNSRVRRATHTDFSAANKMAKVGEMREVLIVLVIGPHISSQYTHKKPGAVLHTCNHRMENPRLYGHPI